MADEGSIPEARVDGKEEEYQEDYDDGGGELLEVHVMPVRACYRNVGKVSFTQSMMGIIALRRPSTCVSLRHQLDVGTAIQAQPVREYQ